LKATPRARSHISKSNKNSVSRLRIDKVEHVTLYRFCRKWRGIDVRLCRTQSVVECGWALNAKQKTFSKAGNTQTYVRVRTACMQSSAFHVCGRFVRQLVSSDWLSWELNHLTSSAGLTEYCVPLGWWQERLGELTAPSPLTPKHDATVILRWFRIVSK